MKEKPLVFRSRKCQEALRKCREKTETGTICTEMRDGYGRIIGYANVDIREWARTHSA